MLVEIHHEHLVLWIAGAGKLQSSGNDQSTLAGHASAVVNHEAYRYRQVLVAEMLDLLACSVLINLKVVFVESGNKNAFAVLCRCVQDHQIGIDSDFVEFTRRVL